MLHGVYGASLLQASGIERVQGRGFWAVLVGRSLCREEKQKPEGFKDYQRQSGSVGIISMLHQIIGDARVMETKARVSLSDADAMAAARSPCWGV